MKKALFGLFSLLFALSISLVATEVNKFNYLTSEAKIEIGHDELGVDFMLADNSSAGGGTAASVIPIPQLSLIQVLPNGRIFIIIDTVGKSTTSHYDFYENNISQTNLVARIPSSQDTLTILSGAESSIKNFVVRATNGCDTTDKTVSAIYSTILPSGSLTAPCAAEFTLNWNAPTGFSSGIKQYIIYVDSTGNGYQFLDTIKDAMITSWVIDGIRRNISYKFIVEAYSNNNTVNVSTAHLYNSPVNLTTYIIVPAPTARCAFVHDNGSVTLSWLPAKDSTNNFSHYNIRYKKSSESVWTEIPGDADDLLARTDHSYTIVGINAQAESYNFEINTLSGCDGRSPANPNFINSIFISAVPRLSDTSSIVDLSWNLPGVDYGANNNFELFKDVDGNGFSFLANSTTLGLFTDSVNSTSCSSILNYHLSLTDSAFQSQGFSCVVKSNNAVANIIDSIPPKPVDLKLVSYDLASGGLNVFWDGSNEGYTRYINLYVKDGFNSGLPLVKHIIQTDISLNPPLTSNKLLIPMDTIDASKTSIAIASLVSDSCDNFAQAAMKFHQTIAMNVGWLVKDSINKLSWNAYVGFNENFDVEYDVFYTNSLSDPWVNAGSAGINRTFEHKVPDGNEMYYYHVKASSKDTLMPMGMVSNSNIGLVYSAFVDTTIGIIENRLQMEIGLYPNPVKEQLTLKYSGDRNLNFTVYNSQGQEIEIKTSKAKESYLFNVQSLVDGFYIIRINDGERQTSLKFLKE